MNVKQAKALRKSIYGDEDFRERKYYVKKHVGTLNGHVQIFADEKRQAYQIAKRQMLAAKRGF